MLTGSSGVTPRRCPHAPQKAAPSGQSLPHASQLATVAPPEGRVPALECRRRRGRKLWIEERLRALRDRRGLRSALPQPQGPPQRLVDLEHRLRREGREPLLEERDRDGVD